MFLASTLVGHVNDQLVRLNSRPMVFHYEDGTNSRTSKADQREIDAINASQRSGGEVQNRQDSQNGDEK